MMRHASVVDYDVLKLQGQAINQIIEEIDYVLDIVHDQQEEIEFLHACVDELAKLALQMES